MYFLSIFKIPKYIDEKFEKNQRNFLWSGTEEKKKFAPVSWDKVCMRKSSGGLGIRDAQCTNKALLSKVGWDQLRNKKY